MIPEETINKFIRDVINLILGIDGFAIRAKQNAPRPSEDPYADVDFLNDVGVGWEQTTYSNIELDTKLDSKVEGMRSIGMSLGFYRDGSRDNARKVRTGLVRDSIHQLFLDAGLGLGVRSEIRNIDEPLENGWEERTQFDVFLSTIGSDDDIIESIGSIEINSTYETNGNVYSTKIEV